MRGLVVASPRSGSGKTTLTLGLLAALRRRGLAVAAAKAGPDYIDPAFHAAATGRDGVNLDSWAMRPALLDGLAAAQAAGVDLVVCEGLMGLYDGVAAPGACGDGSTADLAARFGWPVVLILDVSGQSQSAGAVAAGFAHFREDVPITGVVLNRVASPRHTALASRGVERAGLAVLGAIARRDTVALPERHLGLVQAGEHPALAEHLAAIADLVEASCDLDAILAAAAGRPLAAAAPPVAVPPPGQRIALARDAAFSFAYPHLLAGWRRAGAEILPFSPLADEPPPEGADACWLPGGYPELDAGRLAAAGRFLGGLRSFAETRPVHGECGGHMVLGRTLTDAAGATHAMAGLLGHATSFAVRRLHLGYRRATLRAGTVLGRPGTTFRGHEFHYATTSEDGGDEPLFDVVDATGTKVAERGGRRGHVTGTFFHLIDAG